MDFRCLWLPYVCLCLHIYYEKMSKYVPRIYDFFFIHARQNIPVVRTTRLDDMIFLFKHGKYSCTLKKFHNFLLKNIVSMISHTHTKTSSEWRFPWFLCFQKIHVSGSLHLWRSQFYYTAEHKKLCWRWCFCSFSCILRKCSKWKKISTTVVTNKIDTSTYFSIVFPIQTTSAYFSQLHFFFFSFAII